MKCIIPVAGAGTRLQPATNVVPKFMLPLGNKPFIQYAFDEIEQANITEVVFIVSPSSEYVGSEAWFLDRYLSSSIIFNKEGVEERRGLNKNWTYTFKTQLSRLGLGDAVKLGCSDFEKDERFLVILPDDIYVPSIINKNPSIRLLALKMLSVSSRKVSSEEASNYGVITIEGNKTRIEEKPKNPSSNWVVFGRYTLTKNAMQYTTYEDNVECSLSSVHNSLLENNNLEFSFIEGDCYLDCGNLKSYKQAWSSLCVL
jgi:UTP-glucose-1-phosphate uridylyltransferase